MVAFHTICTVTNNAIRGTHRYSRHISSSSTPSLLSLLQRNPELDEHDAKNELRWIKAALRDSSAASSTSGVSPASTSREKIYEERLESLVKRRSAGEPLQYVLGTTDFGPLTLLCRPPTLIPRPETAHIFTRLAELLLTCHGDWRPLDGAKQTCPDQDQTLGGLRILDLCTGSGSIPLLLAHLLDTRCDRLIGYDYHPSAVELARENLELVLRQASTEKGVGRRAVVAAHQGDIFDEAFVGQVLDDFQSHPHVRERTELGDHLAGPMREKGTGKEEGQGDVDLVVSNPPYIARTEWEELPPSVKDYEDPRALIGERVLSTPISPASPPAQITESTMNTHGKGLVFYERIAEILPDVLSPVQDLQRRGWNSGTTPRVAVEIGHEQGEDVKAIFGSVGMRCEVWQDQYERDRMVVGWHR